MEDGAGAAQVKAPRLLLPTVRTGPLRAVAQRVAVALLLMLAVVAVVYADRDGYRDTAGGRLSLLDAFYYASVTITTTGYGDITPVSPGARLVNIVFVTPVRLLFIIVLVGTTLEVLAERTRQDWRRTRWRKRVRDHVVVAGYGTKGRATVRTLLATGVDRAEIVVVDPDPRAVQEAASAGFAGIVGDASRRVVLERAEAGRARQIVVAGGKDDTAVLITLTARELNPSARIHAAVRESENASLLRQSGADQVVASSEAAGRLLGLSTSRPSVGVVLTDLLEHGSGLDLDERAVRPEEVGATIAAVGAPVLAVIRDGGTLPFDDPACSPLHEGDRLIVARSGQERRQWRER